MASISRVRAASSFFRDEVLFGRQIGLPGRGSASSLAAVGQEMKPFPEQEAWSNAGKASFAKAIAGAHEEGAHDGRELLIALGPDVLAVIPLELLVVEDRGGFVEFLDLE